MLSTILLFAAVGAFLWGARQTVIAFLFTIFPNLRWSVILAGLVTLPLMYALWWLDPFRIRRLPALASMLACVAALVGYSLYQPDEAWRGYYDDGYLSKFFRSGVSAVSDFAQYGFMESAASTDERLKMPLVDACHPAGRRPNIVMIHDESSFDIRAAQGIKVPAGYGSHFKSFDGKQRTFLAEKAKLIKLAAGCPNKRLTVTKAVVVYR